MTTVKGSCHCGAVTFEAEFEERIETSRCNCSICRKSRFWKTIVPSDAFTLLSGGDSLHSYRFGPKVVDHRICGTCGVKVFGTVPMDDMEFVAISVPCLDLDPQALAALPVRFEDGLHDAQEREPEVTSYL
ncbi:GFA family protein [Celeribacter indicus]|uniref:CENP-V/GFA domain-containing protein n=1 Tax=Celeribacter indicus TaxID=1208324 RepID=A0A0B5E128_9RHOB|nr:GFA family protein [Celeribacter indicus]AJE46696.1 hypothetical protein P73_1981 [Celeribacter indicus]SDX04198.1 Uncharacterized conserved protein [Celeribacter indicus]